MAYSKSVWDQLKNLTAEELTRALKKDGWTADVKGGSIAVYLKQAGDTRHRVSIHYHAHKTYGRKMLQALLKDIGWSEADLRRLKLIKKG